MAVDVTFYYTETNGPLTQAQITAAGDNGIVFIPNRNLIYAKGSYYGLPENNITADTIKSTNTGTLGFGSTLTIPSITYDSYGRITSTTTTSITLPANPNTDTHYKALPVLGNTSATTNSTTAVVDPYLNIIENNAKSGSILIKGTGNVAISAANGILTVNGEGIPNSRQVKAGKGLTGGGALTSDVTINHADKPGIGGKKVAAIVGQCITAIHIDDYGHVATVDSAPALSLLNLSLGNIPDLPSSKISSCSGYVLGADTQIKDTDTLNEALGKIQGQINSVKSNIAQAMHFKGAVATKDALDKVAGMVAGDVYIVSDSHKEYVYDAASKAWVELGDESMLSKLYDDVSILRGRPAYTDEAKRKLDGIAENANNYVHPTTSGNKHIPAGGRSGDVLQWAADGTATWNALVLNAVSAGKLSNFNVGSHTQFIYFSDGMPKPSNQSLGSATLPVYLSNGTFTLCAKLATKETTDALRDTTELLELYYLDLDDRLTWRDIKEND